MRLRALALVSLAGCIDFAQDVKTCIELGRCAPPVAECPGAPFPPPPTKCGSDRDLYLAADGDDGNDASLSSPRRTLVGFPLLAGDRIHLAAGVWDGGFGFQGDGLADCPITIEGAPGNASVVRVTSPPLRVSGSHWRVSSFRVVGSTGATNVNNGIEVRDGNGGRVSGVSVVRVDFHALELVQSVLYFERCDGCSVLGSSFDTEPGVPFGYAVQVWATPGFVFRGNRVKGGTVETAIIAQSSSTGVVVEGNEFEGGNPVDFRDPGGRFTRNVVRDVNGGVMVVGAELVSHNTFLRLGTGSAARGGAFVNNVVSLAGLGYDGAAHGDGGFNLFNAVAAAYSSGNVGRGDLTALPALGADLVPMSGSPLVDAADPSSPVPPGGGLRADIGARELGATRSANGTYCFSADGG